MTSKMKDYKRGRKPGFIRSQDTIDKQIQARISNANSPYHVKMGWKRPGMSKGGRHKQIDQNNQEVLI